jgi:hypothetical protein
MVSAGDLLDPRPMLQKHVHHVQRVALAVITVDRGTILQRLAGDALDDAGFAVCHMEHYAIKKGMAGVVIALQRHCGPPFRQAATRSPTVSPYRAAVSASHWESDSPSRLSRLRPLSTAARARSALLRSPS